MDVFLIIVAILLGLLGIVGSVVPGIPGPPLSWVGLLLMYFFGDGSMSLTFLIVWLAIVIVVTVVDYVVPAFFTKLTGGSKWGSIGAIIGLVAGIFLAPIGMIAGALVGAFLAELIFANQSAGSALKSAFGAFLGFICGSGLKLIVTGLLLFYIIKFI